MKKTAYIIFLLTCTAMCISINAQENKVYGDIDKDGIADTVYIDSERVVMGHKLSSQQFRAVETSLLDESYNLWLHLDKESVTLTRNANRYTEFFTFGYLPEENRLVLTTFRMEQLGNAMGDGYTEIVHSLRSGKLLKNTVTYTGSYDAVEPKAEDYLEQEWEKRIEPIYLYFENFSSEDYYNKTEAIWDESSWQLVTTK